MKIELSISAQNTNLLLFLLNDGSDRNISGGM